MSELLALTSRHLRSTLRGRAARAGAVLFAAGLGAAVLMVGADARGAGLLLLGSFVVLAFFVSGFAVGAGAALPEDRVAGREAWLAALAPAGWQRRMSVVLSAWVLAVTMGALGGLLIGVLATVLRADLPLHSHAPVVLPEGALLTAGAPPLAIALPAARDRPEVEIDVRPLFRRADLDARMPPDRVEVAWAAGKASGILQASVRGPLRVRPPPEARTLDLALRTDRVRLRLAAARRLGPVTSPLLAITWIGLLLGVLAASVAPVAVLLSRVTTAQTAAAGAFSLLLCGALKRHLVTLAADLRPTGLLAFAPDLLRGTAWIAPDAPLLHLVSEAGSLRAAGAAGLALLLPALLYAAVTCVPACLPAPAAWRTGANS